MAEYESELLLGLAQFLHNREVGHYSEDGVQSPNLPEIYLGRMPGLDLAPLRVLALTPYDSRSISRTQAGTEYIQIRYRTGPDPIEGTEMRGRLRRELHEMHYIDLGNVRVSTSRLESFAPMGDDANGNPEYAANFSFTGMRYVR